MSVKYPILAIIIFIAVKIRTSNLYGLKDITTGTWTLGPDLDPFLFLRWAKNIVENGSLMAVDMMRYVPLGFETSGEYILHPYMIAWFHNVAQIFGSESVTYSAIIYPVFFFVITIVAFFLLTRKIFLKRYGNKVAGSIALISAFFLTVIPSLLPRTIAGIPEKESAAFFFLFMAFYLFISAWQSENKYWKYGLAILAGIFTVGMALVWGGYIFIFLVIGPSIFISFILGKISKERAYVYGLWLVSSLLLMNLFSPAYNLRNLLSSITTGSAIGVFFIILLHPLLFKTNLKKYFEIGKLGKMPPQIITTVIAAIIGILVMSLVGDTQPAQKMKDAMPEDPQAFLKQIMDSIKRYYKLGFVHGDLSKFNILNYNQTPVLIDFSQASPLRSPHAKEMLKRDIHNVSEFFRKLDVEVNDEDWFNKITSK